MSYVKLLDGVCSVCHKPATLVCSDCRIDFGVSVYVCSNQCMQEHELKCSKDLRDQIVAMKEEFKKILGQQAIHLRLSVEKVGSGGGERDMYKVYVFTYHEDAKNFYFVTPNKNPTWQELLLDIAQSQNLNEMGELKRKHG